LNITLSLHFYSFFFKHMKRATEVLRRYSAPDAAMRQHMRTMHTHFTANQAAFQAFNPRFDAAFGAQWLAAVEAADTAPTGAVRVGELKEDTAAVQDLMSKAQQAVQQLFYFVGQAFPNNVARLDQYGRRGYVAARDSHDKMRTLLQTAFASATRDQAALAAHGYTAAQLAQFGTLGEQLTATNTAQEVKKGQNTEGSDAYLTLQNRAYGYGQEVSAAAKVLFTGEVAKARLFRLAAGAPAGPERHEATVAPGAAGYLAFETPLLAATQLRLRLLAPAAGQRAFVGRVVAEGQKPPTPQSLSAEVPELLVLAPELGAAGQLLAVVNQGPEAAHVEVAVVA
jgi:hypothetical protein